MTRPREHWNSCSLLPVSSVSYRNQKKTDCNKFSRTKTSLFQNARCKSFWYLFSFSIYFPSILVSSNFGMKSYSIHLHLTTIPSKCVSRIASTQCWATSLHKELKLANRSYSKISGRLDAISPPYLLPSHCSHHNVPGFFPQKCSRALSFWSPNWGYISDFNSSSWTPRNLGFDCSLFACPAYYSSSHPSPKPFLTS